RNIVYSLNTPFKYAAGPAASAEIEIFGNSDYTDNNNPNTPNHHIRLSVAADLGTYGQIKDTTYKGYERLLFNLPVDYSRIGNQTSFKLDVINDIASLSDLNSVSYILLNYARQYDLGSSSFLRFKFSPQQVASRSLVSFQNYGATAPVLYDLGLNMRIYASK